MCKVPILECSIGVPPRELYRDSHGKRVVCDLEGDWDIQCLGVVPEDLHILTGTSLQVTTDSLATDWGWVAKRQRLGGLGDFSTQKSASDGLGWVSAFDCNLELNNDSRPFVIPPEFGTVTLPYWNGFRSNKLLKVEPLTVKRLLLADFCPSVSKGTSNVNFLVERASQVEILESTNGRGEKLAEPVFSHLNRASWDVTVPEEGKVLIIERRFDAFHGLQRARVFFDDEFIDWWHCPLQDRVNRWAADSCHLRLSKRHRGRTVRITLDPPAGVPLFSIGHLRVFAVVP